LFVVFCLVIALAMSRICNFCFIAVAAGLEQGSTDEANLRAWTQALQPMDAAAWAEELNAEPITSFDLLGRTVQVETYVQADVEHAYISNVHGFNSMVMHHFAGPSALGDAASMLTSDEDISMHPSVSDAQSLRQCRDDPKCEWIWTTSSLLGGAEVEITGVIGSFNTSLGGTRCHVLSQETDVTCHRHNPAIKFTRGEAFLLEGVPTAFPNQTALPIAMMCHYHYAAVQNKDLGRWCHLVSGKQFLVVPKGGINEIGVVSDKYPGSSPGQLMQGINFKTSQSQSLRGSNSNVAFHRMKY